MNLLRKYKIYKITDKIPQGIEGKIILFISDKFIDLKPFKIYKYPNDIWYMNNKGKCVLEYNYIYKILYVRYDDLWEVLESHYFIDYKDISIFLQYVIKTEIKPHMIEKTEPLRQFWFQHVEEEYNKR